MIRRVADIIPSADCGTQNAAGMWVRAVPYLYRWGWGERFKGAWAALWRDDVVVVAWPYAGEFEQALAKTDNGGGDRRDRTSRPQPPQGGHEARAVLKAAVTR